MKCFVVFIFLLIAHGLACAMEPAAIPVESKADGSVLATCQSDSANRQKILLAVDALDALAKSTESGVCKKAVRILLCTLCSAAASYVGYRTKHDWITIFVGSIAAHKAEVLFRANRPFLGFLIGLALWLAGDAVDLYLLGFHYPYGSTTAEATIWSARALCDCLAWLTGYLTPEGKAYAALPRKIRTDAQAEFSQLERDIESGMGAQKTASSKIDFTLDIV